MITMELEKRLELMKEKVPETDFLSDRCLGNEIPGYLIILQKKSYLFVKPWISLHKN